MKLKPIEDGMVVHCKTEDEAKELIKWAANCSGYDIPNTTDSWNIFKNETCYRFMYDKSVRYDRVAFYKRERFEILEFTDLIIPEEEKHMSAEEILNWMVTNRKNYVEVFGERFIGLNHLVIEEDPKEIISKIESYEANKKQKKEPEIVWIFRTFSTHEMEAEMFSEEKDAIKWCEDMSRKFPGSLNKYDKTCLLKEFLPDIKVSDMIMGQ